MSHKHIWKQIAKTYALPVTGFGGRMSNETYLRLTLGMTTILWECECGELRREEMYGKEQDNDANT